ncbi:MAG: RHS repeat protein [Ignavibacteriae bacterium]|nr:MAG: RHS repeat protein [Ignavibacteriota bacterium]
METKTKFTKSFIFFLLTAFLLVFAQLTPFNYITIPESVADTQDDNYQIFNARDLSSSFNERGYLNSNSASFDGQEIVNDYNGNLMFKIPLGKSQGKGDLSYEFSLNYNGNINYTVICSDITGVSNTTGQLHQYNISAPGWVFSFNGLAVQMLNFESSYFTKPTNGTEARGRYVHMLANGYHITDMLTTVGPTTHDKITIMLGDGSTEVLENVQTNSYSGWYKSTSKNNFMKAFVKFLPNTDSINNPSGAARKMYLMKGDSLTYIYNEYPVYYLDHGHEPTAPWYKPMIFLLSNVADRYGHEKDYKFFYNDRNGSTGDRIGRPWLASYPGGIFLYYEMWGSYLKMRAMTPDGYYTLYTDVFGTYSDNIHNPRLNRLLNPAGEEMQFVYEAYNRKGEELYNSDEGDPNMTILLSWGNDALYRLTGVTNYNGGVKEYSYVSPTSLLTADYSPNHPEIFVHSGSNHYMGQGRDYFFANMISLINVKENNSLIRTEAFEYTYTLGGDRQWNNVWLIPVDSRDLMTTKRTVTAGSGSNNNNNTPTEQITVRSYKNFRTKETQSSWQTVDYEGQIKLITEEYSLPLSTPFKTITHGYNLGTGSTGEVYNGTFLDSLLVESYNGVSRQWAYYYVGGGDSLITEKTQIDPLGLITRTKYSAFEKYNYEVYEEGSFKYPELNTPDTAWLYLIEQPYEITISKNSITLQKKEIHYYDPTTIFGADPPIEGYPGQISEEINIDPQNENNRQTIQYQYYSQDTNGYDLYDSLSVYFSSSTEGSLSEITDANGNITKYYYYLISRDEDATYGTGGSGDEIYDAPKLSYHKLKEHIDTVEKSSMFSINFTHPSRIDQYVTSGNIIRHYQKYNKMGQPISVINENNYISTFAYGLQGRLDKGTLPYDFTNISDQIDTTIDSTESEVEIICNTIGWGNWDDNLSGYRYFVTDPSSINTYFFFDIDYDADGGGDDINWWRNATMKLGNANFTGISHVDSAFVEFAPSNLYCKVNGNYSNDFSFRIRPLVNIGENVKTLGTGLQTYGTLNCSQAVDCDNLDTISHYQNNYNKLYITDILNQNIVEGVGGKRLNLMGLQFDASGPSLTSGHVEIKCEFNKCRVDTNVWNEYSRPKVHIYAKKTTYDTTISMKYNSGTVIYGYDDKNDSILVRNKIDGSSGNVRYKKTTNYFDKFYKVKQTNFYTGSASPSTTYSYYNYLDQKGRVTDARNNSTRFSYNMYGNLSRTDNPDESYSFDTTIYYGGITTHWGRLDCLVKKGIYTDEVGNEFHKHFDAVDNLKKEVKFIGSGLNIDSLVTEYNYDNLNRVIEVYTAAGKSIYYTYDCFGRQYSRTTPDAGEIKFKYDLNGNLRFSQDANQTTGTNPKFITFRAYDGINRLKYIGEADRNDELYTWSSLDGTSSQYFENYSSYASNFLTINVYDTITNGYEQYPSLFNIPGDYHNAPNFTKGSLLATAYRTRHSDGWNFKYYRYDPRGRVIRMWNVINGLGTKVTDYTYNSANQVESVTYQDTLSNPDYNYYTYEYDDAGRLKKVNAFGDSEFGEFCRYSYDENSMLKTQAFNENSYVTAFDYNTRNWLDSIITDDGVMNYALSYYANGNVQTQNITGTYNDNIGGTDLNYTFTYDRSNRFLYADFGDEQNHSMETKNTYDKDGNILTMQRWGGNGSLTDNFNYNYISGTNKLNKITGEETQYSYDNNGNLTSDIINYNGNMIYDYRNLLIESRNTTSPNVTFFTRYYYDEAGNRIRKWTYHSTNGGSGTDGGDTWVTDIDEYYSRDASGKELAIYSGSNLTQWNVYGIDNVGKINNNRAWYCYVKDHLGSIRAVLDESYSVVSAMDFDPWGYEIRGSINNRYSFTGKEKDQDIVNNYLYFGARYYDARIGRWGGVEPKYDKYVFISPYSYANLNPIVLKDYNGKDFSYTVNQNNGKYSVTIYAPFYYSMNGPGSFTTEQRTKFIQEIRNASDHWNDAAKLVKEFNGNSVEVKFKFSVIEVGNIQEKNDAIEKKRTGENIGFSDGNKPTGMSENGFAYRVRSVGFETSDIQNRGSHEMAHALGLPDAKDNQAEGTITSYNEDRDVSEKDVNNILKQLDFEKGSGIVKGWQGTKDN